MGDPALTKYGCMRNLSLSVRSLSQVLTVEIAIFPQNANVIHRKVHRQVTGGLIIAHGPVCCHDGTGPLLSSWWEINIAQTRQSSLIIIPYRPNVTKPLPHWLLCLLLEGLIYVAFMGVGVATFIDCNLRSKLIFLTVVESGEHANHGCMCMSL